MTRQQQATVRKAAGKRARNPILPGSSSGLHAPVESLLRDLAVVLHATATIRRSMEAKQTICSAVS